MHRSRYSDLPQSRFLETAVARISIISRAMRSSPARGAEAASTKPICAASRSSVSASAMNVFFRAHGAAASPAKERRRGRQKGRLQGTGITWQDEACEEAMLEELCR